MAYIEVDITIKKNRIKGADISIAELGSIGYESFLDTDLGVKAYIREDLFDSTQLNNLTIFRSREFGASSFNTHVIKDINWNKKWESEYKAVSIYDFCHIRSSFHPASSDYQHEIVIEPKMSFGTGHHETTWLMAAKMKDINFKDKTVLDVGCGTGVLSILASLLQAGDITAIDIDRWAFENSKDNLQLNNIKNCNILQGNISAVAGNKYNIILANITRNINMEYLAEYKSLCTPGGHLLLSGFYLNDLEIIKKEAGLHGFSYIDYSTKNNWVSVLFLRQE